MTLYVTTPVGRRFNRMSRMMDRALADPWPVEADVVFPVDIQAEADDYVITALLPGIKAEDLSIQIVNETLTLQGEFPGTADKDVNYILQERPSGRFCRTLHLPERLDAAKAQAELQNGVLTLRIPKAEEARPKTIKIQSK